MREYGKSYAEIGSIVGVHPTTVCQWFKRYKRSGEAALRGGQRGRRPGSGSRLSATQARRIRRLITDKLPEQLKLSFALWTRQAVADLIEAQYGVRLPIRTVGDYLARWGMTPIRRLRPGPKPKAPRFTGGDEAGVRSDAREGRSYAPRGQTPVAPIPVRRVRVRMISTVTNAGQMRFMLLEEPMHATLLLRFFKRLIASSDRKVFVILDNLQVHRGHVVRDWVRDHADAIELFYLPSYSPQLNPDEYLNNALKARVHRHPPARSARVLHQQMLSALRSIQRRIHHVRHYFKHPKVQYAAA